MGTGRLLNVLQQLVPLIVFYPWWAQVLFALTLALLLISLFVFIIYYGSAFHKKIEMTEAADVNLHVSVVTDSAFSQELTDLNYQVEESDLGLEIGPRVLYLTKLEEGGPIFQFRNTFGGVPFEWNFPVLDLKVLNNTKKTVLLTKAVFEIRRSVLDPLPVIAFWESATNPKPFRILILNEGWGEVRDCSLRFNIAPFDNSFVTHQDVSELWFDSPFSHRLDIGHFVSEVEVDISEYLACEGIDIERLKRWEQQHPFIFPGAKQAEMDATQAKMDSYLGRFRSGTALVYGYIDYTGREVGGLVKQHSVRFATVVWLHWYEEELAMMGASHHYNAKFETDREDYTVQVPISHVLQPGEADRFQIRIGVDRSSLHEFRIKLLYKEDRTLVSSPITMRLFVPRSATHSIERTTSTSW